MSRASRPVEPNDSEEHEGELVEVTIDLDSAARASSSPAAIDDALCHRAAIEARRAVEQIASRRFFAFVAEVLDRPNAATLAHELTSHLHEDWVRDTIDRGLELFAACIDDAGRRCVATLVAEYLGWREPPDAFFHRVGSLLLRRRESELVRLARILTAYARLPKPGLDEQRLLAAIPRTDAPAVLAVLGFVGQPACEWVRGVTELPSLGADPLVSSLAAAELGWLAEPGPLAVPLVGRALLWFPLQFDADLRRLHMLFSAAIH